ncbi:Bug family tripartite tricarboxylate transporter substrate binding protein [Xanthobacter tagetidis]|jgi:tripartite-type tricarboxylate transporter receptor subunit TctC|uniref:Tripartite tricarboxylate transporter substrate binding protein n=1 Tax=Xanthobacter tagetidis TaxID=60216 RepID=A0A3L7AEW0_9HYPH|nr:tripartite tricarboxylate transporter substrate binding protein [Xanthobacter tagetidis]MBB6306742.1 tripartite-type tricarboxylate transporter receptor subunit TctC [Xanthobacter tagetidis]RLP78953.1 tripartite tricarboxylate transporter substrate binding protein [Xanthobacter tagetidis]
MLKRWKILLCSLAVAALGGLAGPAPATAAFPDRPITLIVPWAAGGGTDSVSRMIAALLEKDFGQPVNVVNRTGGSGVVGHTAIAQAKPDGYTIGLITLEISMMHWVGLTDLTYEGFTPLALMNVDPAAIHVKADSKYKTMADLIAAIKANPGKITSSGAGQGGGWHLAMAGMLRSLGINPSTVTWVPATGAATSLTDLAGGGIEFVSCSLPEADALTKAGRVRTLAYMDDKRSPVAPDVPTLKEAVNSEWTLGLWRAMVGPKGMPADIAQKYEAAFKKIFESSEFQGFMKNRGFGAVYMNAADLKAFMAKDDKGAGEVLKDMGLAK